MSAQRPLTKRTRDPDAKRAALLRAAMETFAAKGFAAASMADVARAAGVAVGTSYRFFPAKIDMLRALHVQLADEFNDVMRQAWESQSDYEARLRALVRALFALIDARRVELRVLSMTTDVGDATGGSPTDSVRACIAELASEAMDAGAFHRMDPHHYAAVVHGLVEGAMRHHLRFGDPDGTLARQTEGMICRAVLVRP